MKLFFRKAAQDAAAELRALIERGHYKKAAAALRECRPSRQDQILTAFFNYGSGHVLMAQKPRHFCGSSFVEYLADKHDQALIVTLAKNGIDEFNIHSCDILPRLYDKTPEIVHAILAVDPSLERTFEDALSFEHWQVYAQVEGLLTLDHPVTEQAVINHTGTWLPRRAVRPYIPTNPL